MIGGVIAPVEQLSRHGEEEWLDGRFKAIPAPVGLGEIGARGWRALEDLLMPALLVRRSAVDRNARAMAAYCEARGVKLAPHAKTHMAPRLLARQAQAGAWAFTAATPHQLKLLREWGVQRVVYANQVAEPLLRAWLKEQRDWEVWVLVDSVPGAMALAGLDVEVLVELGHPGGRTGCRSVDAAVAVAEAAQRAGLRVRGVECFEGTARPGDTDTIDALLDRCDELLDRLGLNLVSAGGSAYFDRVVERFAHREVILRSGCYITQDGGFYAHMSPLAGELENALEVWGAVLSKPEPDLVVASFGKRDVSIDLGLPIPFATYRSKDGVAALEGAEVLALSDQHAHIRVPSDFDVRVFDRLGAHVSHPCTTLDKWRLLPVVDDDRRVVEGWLTHF